MSTRELSKLIAELGRLTPLQRKQVQAELSAGMGKNSALAVIERSDIESMCCPHCKSSSVKCNGTANGLQRYKCRDCTKTYNALTGTPLAEVEELLNVSHGTAFRWRHRFLTLPKDHKAQALVGIVETDETFFLES